MLVLSRRAGESIEIGDGIKITILSIGGKRARVGLEAPEDVDIVRSELVDWRAIPAKPSRQDQGRSGRTRELAFTI